MTEKKFTGLIFDNIFPRNIGKESKNVNFHDSNDKKQIFYFFLFH